MWYFFSNSYRLSDSWFPFKFSHISICPTYHILVFWGFQALAGRPDRRWHHDLPRLCPKNPSTFSYKDQSSSRVANTVRSCRLATLFPSKLTYQIHSSICYEHIKQLTRLARLHTKIYWPILKTNSTQAKKEKELVHAACNDGPHRHVIFNVAMNIL